MRSQPCVRHSIFRRVTVFATLVSCSWGISFAADNAKVAAKSRPAWTTSKLAGTPEPPEQFKVVPAFGTVQFDHPTSLEEMPGSDRIIVSEMNGRILSFSKSSPKQPELVVDLRNLLPADIANRSVSLFDIELHPNFVQNHYLYVCYVHPGQGGHSRVSRLTMQVDGKSPPTVRADSEVVVITWPAGGHNAGCLEFGKDGYLYIATGDGSGPNPPDGLTTGQDISDLLGAVLRIDVNHATEGKQYSVPDDNPFVNLMEARPEIWSYGLRNPWKFGVDRKTGDVFVADNGWESWEMIHKLARGGNCGWPVMEGRVALRSEVKRGPTPVIPPVKDHPHTEANSVIGGPVYRGQKIPALNGAFVYGDYITGTIWAIQQDPDQSYVSQTLVDTDLRIVAFVEASGGELYVLDYDFTGKIYELVPSNLKDLSASFPRRLSETGIFQSVKTLTPAPGVVPYDVVASRWMDGMSARRWVAIPGDSKIRLAASLSDDATYPDGTVFVKHISTAASDSKSSTPLETQLLHYENGVWHPYSYAWDEDGADAKLVDSTGTVRPIRSSSGDQSWHVNATNECKLCHNAGPKFVLGFVPNQLNHLSSGSSGRHSQLADLVAQGVLASSVEIPANDPLRLVDPHDSKNGIEDRARSYLHANCSMCHHPGGNAIVSFFLRRDLPFEKLNTNKGTGIGTFGIPDAKIIVPGEPHRSILFYRISKLGYARMPYIGSRMVDSAGISLVEEWIRSLGKGGAEVKNDADVAARLGTTEGALAVASQIHRGQLSEKERTAVLTAAHGARSDIRGLFETFIPESQRRVTLGTRIDPETILSKQGDLERGKLIFHSDNARCRGCHEIDDKSKSIGPTLREINKKYAKPADLLQHVLQPSLKIEDPFAAYSITTHDGRVITGLLLDKSDAAVIVRTAERIVIRIPRQHIDEMTKSLKSLMPELILSDLTAQEAADLFEYIRSVPPAP